MSRILRALIPAIALAGAFMSLAPMAHAGPPPWAAAYGNSHGNYGAHRDDRRAEYYRGGREQREAYERRTPREYYDLRRHDEWRGGGDYRYYHRDYAYQGYRGDRGYSGYSGYRDYGGYGAYDRYGGGGWRSDHGAYRGGRCGTDAALTVVGAVTGGIIGNRSASYENRNVATVVGAIAGGLLGNAIGSSIDDGERGCGRY